MKKHTQILIIAFFIITLIAAIVKIQILYIYDQIPLSGDAPGFLTRAQEMTDFYKFSTREPFWILWTKLFSYIGSAPETGMRIGNIFCAILSGIMIYFIISKLLGTIYGFAAAVFYFFIPYLMLSPIRAHRLELYLLLMLLLTSITLFCRPTKSNSIFLGITSSILSLVRMESLLVIVFSSAWFLLRKKGKAKLINFLLFILSFGTLAGPFFYNCHIEKGNPLFILDTHSRFYAYHERATEKSQISEKDVLNKTFNKPDIGIAGYIFKTHTLPEIISRFIKGYIDAIFRASKHLLSTPVDLSFLIYPAWIGMLLLLFSQKGRILFIWGLIYILPHSFILSTRIAGQPSVDIRFGASSAPLIAFSIAGFFWGLNMLYIRYISKPHE